MYVEGHVLEETLKNKYRNFVSMVKGEANHNHPIKLVQNICFGQKCPLVLTKWIPSISFEMERILLHPIEAL
jgi:hypothetical protein